MITLSACPICDSPALKHYLSCKDHTVSHETFELQQCTACGFVLTNPRPDKNELAHYYRSENYISHSDTSSGLLPRIYRTARRLTLAWKYELIERHTLTKPKKLLDYGCGTGAFLDECARKKLSVTGVEPSPEARTTAIRKTKAPIFPDLATVDDSYDAITLWHVLEHVPELHQTILKLKTLLNENGTMFIAVPNLQSPDAKKYKENWAGYDVPRHLWHFSRDTMGRVINKHHLKIEAILPMKLDAYYVSLLSENYIRKSNSLVNVAKAVLAGWNANQVARKTADYSSLIYIIRK